MTGRNVALDLLYRSVLAPCFEPPEKQQSCCIYTDSISAFFSHVFQSSVSPVSDEINSN